MKVQVFRCWNQSSQQYRVQHQERIEWSLNDGFKGFSDKHQGLAIIGKSTMPLPKQIQGKDEGFDLDYKLRLTIRFKHDLTHLIHKRSSQPKIRVVDYVSLTTTTQNLGGHSGKSNTFKKNDISKFSKKHKKQSDQNQHKICHDACTFYSFLAQTITINMV